MKTNFTLLVFFSILLISIDIQSQDITSTVVGGEYQFNKNQTSCLTEVQRKEVLQEIKSNISQLKSQNRLASDEVQNRGAAHPLFSWPIKKKDGLPYKDVWAISNYVDQNPAFPNKIRDYNCGTKTYDTQTGNHLGVDIFNWPFSWKMMDNDEVEIIAAAPGQIIAIGRSKDDRSCAFNNNTWNAVYVQHADGSVALYGHMKKNSPTSKVKGDMVERGEYLGIVGSSGNSTGPHLHFEVYASVDPDVLVDPYKGDCNTLNSDSWWQQQKPYADPNINAVLTHSAAPDLKFNDCPTQEITNEKNEFAASDRIYFGIYLRDQISGTSVNLKIIRPDNSLLYDWDYKLEDDYWASYYVWNIADVYNMNGQWKWQATYQGKTVVHNFSVGTLSVEDEAFQATSIYPNPFNEIINIKSNSPIRKFSIVDILGKTVMFQKNDTDNITEISLKALSKGLYFLTLESNTNQKKIIKLIKE